MTPELKRLIEAAKERGHMTPEEHDAQKMSFVRAEAAFGSDEDEAEYAAAVRAGDEDEIARLEHEATKRIAAAVAAIQRRTDMTDEFEKIWAFAPDIFDNASIWQDQPSPAGDTTEYTRSDHALALVAAAYEVAAHEAERLDIIWNAIAYDHRQAGRDDNSACARASISAEITEAIRALTPADALAAQRKRDAQTYKMAMEAAAERLRIRGDMGGHVFILAMTNPFEETDDEKPR